MMTMLDYYARRYDFTLTPATRRTINRIRKEASEPTHNNELGAWQFAFARIAVMTEGDLKARGCPDDQIGPLQQFALAEATHLVPRSGQITAERIGAYIAEMASMKWGTEDAMRLVCNFCGEMSKRPTAGMIVVN